MMKIILIIFMTFFYQNFALSDEIDELRDDYDLYEVKKGETLLIIARKNIDRVAGNYKSIPDYIKDIKKWNKHVRNWRRIGGEQLHMTYPYSPHTAIEWAPSLAPYKVRAKIDFLDKEYFKSSRLLPENLHMFTHITASQGTFIEQIGKSKINFQQNSPITFGLGFAYLFESLPTYSNSTSFYYAKLTSAGIATTSSSVGTQSGNVTIPAEIGFSSYLQKNFSSFFSNIYGGVDYEKFTTFNLDEILSGEESSVNTKVNQIVYATAGIGFKFKILSDIIMKLSVSKGVISTGKFNGTKFLLYINQKLGKKIWYHILYKQHMLSGGSSDLTVGRIGVGIGVSLF